MNLVLCADSKCKKKDTCRRFTTNPSNELRACRKTRIEATLKHPDEEVCSKYREVPLTTNKIIKINAINNKNKK